MTRLATFGMILGSVAIGCASDPVTAIDGTTAANAEPSSSGASSDAVPNDDGPDSSGPGPMGSCGNDLIDGTDVCDGTDLAGHTCQSNNFESGVLGCTVNCQGYDFTDCGFYICGDGEQEGDDEDCDGTVGGATCATEGFDNGTLFCTADCKYDLSMCGVCGDGIITDGEDCDIKTDLPASCGSLGYMTGSLQCDENCLFNTSLCSTCGNDLTEGNEDCDGLDVPGPTCIEQGFHSGTLGCQDSCQYDFAACGTCGNSFRDGDELCDANDFGADSCENQGFDSGGLTCNEACDTITTENCGVCGNAVIDGSESCDGALLNGQTCALLGLEGGDLACSATCGFDFGDCDLQPVLFASDSGYQGFSLNPGILPCDDITATGTGLVMFDDTNLSVPLGFSFDFYGMPFSDVFVSSNGTLTFSGDPSYPNQCGLPVPNGFFEDYDLMLAAYWDDLDGGVGQVRHQTLGTPGNQRFVVEWNIPSLGGNPIDLYMVRAVLHEAGNIDVCYEDTINGVGAFGNSGSSATAGIQQDSATGFQFSCNTTDLPSGLLLMYLPI